MNLDDHPQFWRGLFGRGLASFNDNDNDRDDHHSRKVVTKYNFDVFGNLQSVTLPDGRVISYIVDGQNRRVGKLVNGKLVRGFIYQSQTQIAAELDGSGHIVKQFIYGTKPNVPDYMIMNGREYRIISNQVGTPLYVVDSATGRIVERETMDEFGYDSRTTWRSILPFGFAGGIYDHDTGLVRFGARDYDPETGRWVSKDPILFNGGTTNLFEYSLNDPINAIDSLGTQGEGDGDLVPISPGVPPYEEPPPVGVPKDQGAVDPYILCRWWSGLCSQEPWPPSQPPAQPKMPRVNLPLPKVPDMPLPGPAQPKGNPLNPGKCYQGAK